MTSRAQQLSMVAAACLAPLLGVGDADAATYYVATTGSDSNDGMTVDSAWATVTYAATIALAGDTVYIKAGLYPDEEVVVANSGTEGAPIVFQGYTNEPGDTPDPQYSPGSTLDSTLLPVLEASAQDLLDYPGRAIGLWSKSYVEIRNLGVTKYFYGIYPQESDHIVIENVYVVDIGAADGQGAGIWFYDCANMTLRNCVVTDASMQNITLQRTHDSLVENCHTYAVTYDPVAVSDYHLVLVDSQNNVVRSCQADNLHADHPDIHSGHGIGIKDVFDYDAGLYPNPHSTGNRIIDCATTNVGESFFVAHEAHDNEFEGGSAWGDSDVYDIGIIIRDGAHDNTFRGFHLQGLRGGVSFQETVEGTETQVVTGNTVANSVFVDTAKALEFWNADHNLVTNCVFDSTGEWAIVRFPFERVGHGNSMRNSIITNVSGALISSDGSPETFAVTYTDFWQNAFEMAPGAGNLALDPRFANAAEGDYHLRSVPGRWDPGSSTWVQDTETSPGIDTGHPDDDFSRETCPNGGRIDLGNFGNTEEASLSTSTEPCTPGAGPETGSASEGGCSCSTREDRRGLGWLALSALALAVAARRRGSRLAERFVARSWFPAR
jgi:MYXO-CTERM domain-containing protein